MFVYESLEDVLKPRHTEEIDSKMDPIIDRFVNAITKRDFEEDFEMVNSFKKDMRKFIQNGKVTYLASPDSMYEVVDALAAREKDLGPSTTTEFVYKFPEFHDLWMNLQINDNNLKGLYLKVANKVIEKIAKKFNIEY